MFIGWARLVGFSAVAAGFACLPAGFCFAGIPVLGAKAAGMGTAFVAVADDPSAIAYNPAGLAGSRGTRIYGGATAVIPSSKYERPQRGFGGVGVPGFLPAPSLRVVRPAQ
jgi:long-subunit fatty acid transport protein